MKKTLSILLCASSMLYSNINQPSNLKLTPTATSVTLSWSDNSDNESGFKIFRDDKIIATTAKNITTYIDIGLEPNRLYKYTIKATNDKDSDYLYHDKRDIIIEVASDGKVVEVGEGVGIWQSDGEGGSRAIVNAYEYNSFLANVDENLFTSYKIIKKIGGFDIQYTIINSSNKDINLPILKVPKIGFGDIKSLKVLNPLFAHYLEERDLKKEQKEYFNVGNFFRTIDGKRDEEHYPYGSQFVYSPVIIATNSIFSVGASLNLDYNQKKYRLLPLMRITKDSDDYWSYQFDLKNSIIKANDRLYLNLSLRVADKDNFIFTIHPYKEFLNHTLTTQKMVPDKKDLRAIQSIEMGGFGDGVGDRFWSGDILKPDATTIDLKWFLDTKGEKLAKNGIQRATFWNFSGLYKNLNNNHYSISDREQADTKYGMMQEQLPFQFVSKQKGILPDQMRADLLELEKRDDTNFRNIEVGYDWGISGNIPINRDGEVLKFDEWQPYDIVKFDINNINHKEYARHFLNEAKSLKGNFTPKFIRLDAFVRMDQDESNSYGYGMSRIKWLKELKKTLYFTRFATESSIDYMQAYAANILQPDSIYGWKGLGKREEQDLKDADLLAAYLNPGAETYVWINANAQIDRVNQIPYREDIREYIEFLISKGYTPLIEYWDVVDLRGIDTAVPKCMDRIDNDNDGKIDWPYDKECKSPADNEE